MQAGRLGNLEMDWSSESLDPVKPDTSFRFCSVPVVGFLVLVGRLSRSLFLICFNGVGLVYA